MIGAEIAMCTATLLPDLMAAGEAEVRVAGEAALAAGFTEVSAWAHHATWLADVGLGIGVVEAATGWASGDTAAAAAEAENVVGIAARHGASRILAVTLEPELADVGRARDNLTLLADTAAAAGIQVCVEFLPWTGIPDLATAWSLVEPLDASATVLLDTWHWERQPGGPALDLLGRIPGDRIGYVQLCDAAAVPGQDLMAEAMSARLLPGEGVVDFEALLAVLDRIGAQPFVATEVFNPALVAAMGPRAAAVAMHAAAERVLAPS